LCEESEKRSVISVMDHITFSSGLAVVGLIVAVTLIQKIRNWLQLRHIPGPPLAGFTRLWMLWHSMGGQIQIILADASRKYGVSFQNQTDKICSRDKALLFESDQMSWLPVIPML
jgi:hypothetical protein